MVASRGGRTALITGLSGQDGSFLADLLLDHGYNVLGTIRPDGGLGAAEHLRDHVQLIEADLLDPGRLHAVVAEAQPDELYHLAAPSFVPEAWRHPAETIAAIATATATILEAARDDSPATRLFVATSATIFGASPDSPQNEDSPCHPLNPYGVAKLAGHQLVGRFREHDGLFACSGILYNHESERRPVHFVTRTVTRAVAAIKLGLQDDVVLGDLDAVRDWSFAGDVMRGAWLTLQHDSPDDYVFASGVPHTVRELAGLAFDHVGLDADNHIRVDPGLVRAREATTPVGDASRARDNLGWEPSISFEQLVARMVDADLRSLATDA